MNGARLKLIWLLGACGSVACGARSQPSDVWDDWGYAGTGTGARNNAGSAGKLGTGGQWGSGGAGNTGGTGTGGASSGGKSTGGTGGKASGGSGGTRTGGTGGKSTGGTGGSGGTGGGNLGGRGGTTHTGGTGGTGGINTGGNSDTGGFGGVGGGATGGFGGVGGQAGAVSDPFCADLFLSPRSHLNSIGYGIALRANWGDDNRPDLLFLQPDNHQVYFLQGEGDGRFSAASPLYVGYRVHAAVADLNGDKRDDLVLVNSATAQVDVYLSEPSSNTLGSYKSYGTGAGPNWVSIADMNKDGWLDLVVANSSQETILILTNNGDGDFWREEDEIHVGTTLYALAVGDMNGDSNQDIVIADSAGIGVALRNSSGGIISLNHQGALPISGRSLFVRDFNSDSKLDVLVSSADGFQLFAGSANGDIKLTNAWHAPNSMPSFDVGDVNGDNKLDVVGADGEHLIFLPGDGAFGFGAARYFAARFWQPVIADLNADGALDVAMSGNMFLAPPRAPQADYAGILVAKNNRNGGFDLPEELLVKDSYNSIAIADQNKDGKQDVLVGTDNTGVRTFAGNGNATFNEPVNVSLGLNLKLSATGDVNNDGFPDLAYAGFLNDVFVALGNGVAWPKEESLGVGQELLNLQLVDADGDKNADLVTLSWGGGENVAVHHSLGDGHFAVPQKLNFTWDLPAFFGVGELDKVANPDWFVAGGAYVEVHSDSKLRQIINCPVTSISGFVVADLNADGRSDFAVSDRASSALVVFLSDSSGTFNSPTYYTGQGTWNSLISGDFNGDGKLDLAGGRSDNFLQVLLGNQTGAFRFVGAYPVYSDPRLNVGQLNADAQSDLVLGGHPYHLRILAAQAVPKCVF